MLKREIARTIVHVPERLRLSAFAAAIHALKGFFLVPVYWLLSSFLGVPGLRLRTASFMLGLRALVAPRRTLSPRSIFHLLFMPMESTRYFEFDFAEQMLAHRPVQRCLDISSPRLLPLSLLNRCPEMIADLINPNPDDLAQTTRLVELLGVGNRCRLHCCLLAEAPFPPQTFDLITSISVLEHIPDDRAAVGQIWDLLKPGGLFLLTVPCMAQAAEQYIDRNEWGLLAHDRDGNVFWQRFYDQLMLEQNVFSITGKPRQIAIYGEKKRGALLRNSERKRSDPTYPYWREPYMMATEYRYFPALDELPGEGVVGLLFVKTI